MSRIGTGARRDRPIPQQAEGTRSLRLPRLGLAAVAALVPAGLTLGTHGLRSTTTSTRFHGTLGAQISGSIRFLPGLLLTTGSSGTVRVTITGTLSNLSGTTTYDGTTITGGSYRSVVTLPAGSSCLSLETNGLPPGTGRVTFTSTGALPAAASNVSWGADTASGPPLLLTFGGAGTSVKGSFAKPSGSASTARFVIDQTQTALLDACESATGLTKMTYTGKAGASGLNLG
jgi:hypothetical protein